MLYCRQVTKDVRGLFYIQTNYCEWIFPKKQPMTEELIVHYDALAQRLMHRIRERGFRIPEDFSIIGHDNISTDDHTFPALTSVSSGTPGEIADTMVELLIKRMNDSGCPRKKVLLEPELIKRKSVLETAQKTNPKEI